MPNKKNWIDFVKQYAKDHGITYREALKKAGDEFRGGGGGDITEADLRRINHIEVLLNRANGGDGQFTMQELVNAANANGIELIPFLIEREMRHREDMRLRVTFDPDVENAPHAPMDMQERRQRRAEQEQRRAMEEQQHRDLQFGDDDFMDDEAGNLTGEPMGFLPPEEHLKPPPKKGKGKKESWVDFCKAYAGVKKCKYSEALKEAGGAFTEYKKLEGAGLLDFLNEFLWKHVAAPVGKAVVKRLTGSKKNKP